MRSVYVPTSNSILLRYLACAVCLCTYKQQHDFEVYEVMQLLGARNANMYGTFSKDLLISVVCRVG